MQHIALIGDYNPAISAHQAIPLALHLAARSVQTLIQVEWLGTKRLAYTNPSELEQYQAFWCTPGSPYQHMNGALSAIRFARESLRPFLGTCGGFQHALIEYAQNVLGYKEADHAESNPDGPMSLVAPLTCPLVEERGRILLQANSSLARIYQTLDIEETYHCRFGLNPSYRHLLEEGGIRFLGLDAQNEVRIAEWPNHPFFIGTLFQPERSALRDEVHPLIQAFVKATLEQL